MEKNCVNGYKGKGKTDDQIIESTLGDWQTITTSDGNPGLEYSEVCKTCEHVWKCAQKFLEPVE